MDCRARVAYESHRLRFGESEACEFRDDGDARAVEAQVGQVDLAEEMPPLFSAVLRKGYEVLAPFLAGRFDEWEQTGARNDN